MVLVSGFLWAYTVPFGSSVQFPFISSTFTIVSRCFSTIVSSLLFRHLLYCCSQLISLFESGSAFSTCLCRSSILVRARLQGNTICTPSFSLSTSSHLHQIKPPHVSQRPRSSQGHRLVQLLCYSAKPHARDNSIAPLRKLAPSFASPSTAFWRFQRLEFPLQPPTTVPKLSSGPRCQTRPRRGPPLSPCAHPCHS